MGNRDDANLSYSAQHIDELLKCPICLDRFTSPRLLPCQHTFCETPCLQQLVNRFHQIKCPECRVEHRVPYTGVSSFPVNRTLQNFLDLPTQAQANLPPPPANQYEVYNDGAGYSNNATNQVQRPPENQNTPQNGSQRTGCSLCSRQLPLSRCAHCDNIVCDTCKRSHIDQLRLDITRVVSQLRRGTPSFSDAISLIENKSEQLHQRAEAGKAEITETIERYISELRNRQRLLHSEVQMWLLGEIRSLRMCQENVEVELASTASFCDSMESTLSQVNQTIPDDDLVDIKRQCVEHMEIMRGYEDGSAVRLPRERQVQVTFEGNRFSQAISNFGELAVVEGQDSSSNGSRSSDPPSLNSRSGSSSRETSPAFQQVVSMGRGRGQRLGSRGTGRGQQNGATGVGRGQQEERNADGRDQQPQGAAGSDREQSQRLSTMDRALAAIGSNQAASTNPRVAPRRGERMAGLMGGGGEAEPDPNPRPAPRERLANLITGGESSSSNSPSRPQQRERMSGLMGAEGGGAGGGEGDVRGGDTDTNNEPVQTRHPLPPNLSWELPVDFAYPRRTDMRAGNGNRGTNTNNRRSLQERRRHNLSDSRLPSNTRLSYDNQTNESSNSNRGRGRNRHQSDQNSAQNSQLEPVAGTSTERSDRPPLVRSRTYTREDFEPIREEDSLSRASTADPVTRPRSPIRFDVNFNGNGNNDVENVPYQSAAIDGSESTRVNVAQNNYQDKGRAIIRFGSRGSNNREFIWPRGMAVSRADQIYIADSSNHRVQVFDNIGTFVKMFGSYGQAETEFDCLAGIAINTMGDILITDRYNHRIQVFDHQGNFKFKFGEEGQGDGMMSYPWGIASDSMGFIYVCDKENHRVQVFQSSGVFARKFGCLGRRVGQFENPHYLAVSPDNKVYVSDCSNHRIQVFSIYGDFLFSFGSIGTMQGQMKYPKGIAIDEQGFVTVADSGNNRIQVFRGDGRFYCMFGGYGSDNGQFKGIEGLALLGNGNVVVSDRENHRIQIF